MLDYRLAFDRPQYLLLLLVVPLLWWIGRESLSGLGAGRRWIALAVRTLLVVLIAFALAEVQLVRTSNRVAVMYVVDRSASIPAETSEAVLQYIHSSTDGHASARDEDRSGVIVFGRDAAVETPPLPGGKHLPAKFESHVDGDATNLAAALRLAQAVFPADAAKRVVLISDGNENSGDVKAQAQQLADLGIGIDVMPLEHGGGREVAVEKIVLPQDIRQGTPFEARVVLHQSASNDGTPTAGRLRISRTTGGQTQTLADRPITVTGDKQVFSFREEIDAPDFYTYSARFVPDEAAGDSQVENNEATAFTHVRGRGQVLLIHDFSKDNSFAELVDLLKRQELEITVQPSNRLFANLAELQRFDLVILADVSRTTGDGADQLATFSDEQIEMLAQNTQHLGSGLLMLGGPDSFGAGGWTNTALEKAMPVDFTVKNTKVVPSGALMLVIDSSGSMSGEKLELSKAAAMAAVRVLGRDDYVGVATFDSEAHWIVPITKLDSPESVLHRIARIDSGGGTNMEPGMSQGYRALREVNAAVKHMVVLSDGQTHGSNFSRMAREAHDEKMTTSSVAIGEDSASALLNEIAKIGGGKFYQVNNPTTIPRIFMKEAMRVSRPVIFEDAAGIAPQRIGSHEILDGIEGDLPALTGFVMTSPKDSPLVEIPLISPRPLGNRNSLLASWQYGLGRSVAFTTDAGQRWTKTWPQWEGYEKLFSQMARWTMRPTDQQGALDVFAEVRDGAIQVVVTALDKDDQFLNFLDLNGTLLGPGMDAQPLTLEQTAPGRYVGRVPITKTGSYFLSVNAGPEHAPARAGINVPYSAEFHDQPSNPQLLRSLASLTPAGGKPGLVLTAPRPDEKADPREQADVFRDDLRRATSRQDSWHLLAFVAGCLFLFDVFNRRVLVSFGWAPAAARKIGGYLRNRPATTTEPTAAIERLQARKNQVGQQLDERRAAARFEPSAGAATELAEETISVAAQERTPSAQHDAGLAPQAEEDTYTTRLLKAKQRAIKDRKGPDGNS
jgi:Mg-chelatase subunit ChlD